MKSNMMKNDEKIISEHKWIPWNRYVFLLEIDGKKTISLGRSRCVEGLRRTADRLAAFRGYIPIIVDTKKKEVVAYK